MKEAAAPDAENELADKDRMYRDQAQDSRKLARPIVLGMVAVSGIILLVASNPYGLPDIARIFDRNGSAPQGLSAQELQQEAIAQLISETDADVAVAAVEGEDAIAQNAALPKSGSPIEAAVPFQLPRLSAHQTGNAERCLTQAIYYEAATETDAGKAAVAQVILNRMRHPAYPNSICAVVYQGSSRPGCQFSFACDGSLARKPSAAHWRRAQEIANSALAGYVHKPVGMATHYHANYVLPYWAPKLAKIEQIGTHIFYRWPGNWGRPRAFSNRYIGQEAIPSFDSLFKAVAVDPDAINDFTNLPSPPPRDPTDHRADNDVGGRVDISRGWTPTIPDPTKGRLLSIHSSGADQKSDNNLVKSE